MVITPYLSILLSCCLDFAIYTNLQGGLLYELPFIPIFELTNYRPISLLSNFSTILEEIIPIRILAFLYKHSIFYNRQFGFRKKHSTIQYTCRDGYHYTMLRKTKKYITLLSYPTGNKKKLSTVLITKLLLKN